MEVFVSFGSTPKSLYIILSEKQHQFFYYFSPFDVTKGLTQKIYFILNTDNLLDFLYRAFLVNTIPPDKFQ